MVALDLLLTKRENIYNVLMNKIGGLRCRHVGIQNKRTEYYSAHSEGRWSQKNMNTVYSVY